MAIKAITPYDWGKERDNVQVMANKFYSEKCISESACPNIPLYRWDTMLKYFFQNSECNIFQHKEFLMLREQTKTPDTHMIVFALEKKGTFYY